MTGISKEELDERIAVAKAAPGVAHMILTRGPYPICELCGGDEAPIVEGRHPARDSSAWTATSRRCEEVQKMDSPKLHIPKAGRSDWIGNNQSSGLTTDDRIWQKTEAGPNGCLLWTGSLNTNGYPRIRIDGHLRSVISFLWERAHGKPPPGWEPDHLCRTRRCINLSHLELVTHQENCRRGNQAKLTLTEVADMRHHHAAGQSISAVAALYGIRYSTARKIIRGGAWKT